MRAHPGLAIVGMVVVVVLGAPATPANAEGIYLAEPIRDPDAGPQLEGDLGFVVGEQPVGPVVATAVGFHAGGGVRWNRLAALAEYTFATLSESAGDRDPAHAYLHRAGVAARYSFGVLRTDGKQFRGDFWLEAGVGRQLVQWRDGGTLGRTDLAFGIAGQFQGRHGRNLRHKLGLYYAARFLFADRPGAKQLPTACGGPCDEPSRGVPVDIGIYFDVGVVFR